MRARPGPSPARAGATELRSDPRLMLSRALLASLLGHALLLNWPLPLSPGGGAGAAGPALPALRVSLELGAEANAIAVREDGTRAQPPVPNAGPDRDAPPGEPGAQDGIPLHGYYPAARLSRMPEGIGIFDIQAPAGGDTGLGGKLTIRVWINAKGGIDNLRVLASGLPADYEQAALAAFENMRFAPGEVNGVPVQSWMDIVIEYADFRGEAAQAPAAGR